MAEHNRAWPQITAAHSRKSCKSITGTKLLIMQWHHWCNVRITAGAVAWHLRCTNTRMQDTHLLLHISTRPVLLAQTTSTATRFLPHVQGAKAAAAVLQAANKAGYRFSQAEMCGGLQGLAKALASEKTGGGCSSALNGVE